MHKVAKNFFIFAEKNKKTKDLIQEKRKQSIAKIREIQQKIQVMSTQKVDLANKLLQFAEMNLDKLQPKLKSQKSDADMKESG